MRPVRLVLVEWVDAVCHDLWEPLDDLDPIDMHVRSVGWLAAQTPEYLTVVPHRQHDQARGGITIPTATVVKIHDLTEPSNDVTPQSGDDRASTEP